MADGFPDVPMPTEPDLAAAALVDGSVVIAAITSCTNTSNPSVMVAAGLVAKKAVEKGLKTEPWVKTSLAPGSKVVTDYYTDSGLLAYLEQLRFHVVGYGCTTCIGNSGPLPDAIGHAITTQGLVVSAVLSGNRNFEGRVHPDVRANYLASPPLVVAYALAGRVDIDWAVEPVGTGTDGRPVFLKDIWPTREEIQAVIDKSLKQESYRRIYSRVYEGDENWQALTVPTGDRYSLGRRLDVHRQPAVLRRHDHRAAAGHRDRQGPGARPPGRQHHDRPHQPGREHQEGQPGREST